MEDTAPVQEIMLEFRAGKMLLEDTRVIPDARKGLVRIGRGEEGLVHFQWLDRGQNIVEDDQIIFPDEAFFEKETRADGDLDICNSVNFCINRPLAVMGDDEEAEVSVPELLEDTADDDISSRAGNLLDQSMAADLTGEVTSSAGAVQLEDLQRILRSIQPAGAIEDPDAGLGLGDILKPDLLLPLIETLPIKQQLASHLPEGLQTPADIIELLQSPPFRQQVDAFTRVLRTGQIDLSQFGIDPSKYKFTVVSFLEALEDSVSRASESGGGAEPQRCSGTDAMDEN